MKTVICIMMLATAASFSASAQTCVLTSQPLGATDLVDQYAQVLYNTGQIYATPNGTPFGALGSQPYGTPGYTLTNARAFVKNVLGQINLQIAGCIPAGANVAPIQITFGPGNMELAGNIAQYLLPSLDNLVRFSRGPCAPYQIQTASDLAIQLTRYNNVVLSNLQ